MSRAAPIRREDWPERLLAFLASRRDKPFAWGENDCALFAADAALEMTGVDFAAPFRGRYDTAFGAMKALRANGAGCLAEYLDLIVDPLARPELARRGDWMMFDSADGPALGVVAGRWVAAPGPDGLVFVPPRLWRRAWRVA